VIIGGLLSSLVLTVFLVPLVYELVDKTKEKLKRREMVMGGAEGA
jgi:HAE1 family hydrophobic/amphiphilic exporter-1